MPGVYWNIGGSLKITVLVDHHDAVYRFQQMPAQYYSDWLKVAAEEALHFSLLNQHLEARGSYYGEYEAHNGLWEMAVKTDSGRPRLPQREA